MNSYIDHGRIQRGREGRIQRGREGVDPAGERGGFDPPAMAQIPPGKKIKNHKVLETL